MIDVYSYEPNLAKDTGTYISYQYSTTSTSENTTDSNSWAGFTYGVTYSSSYELDYSTEFSTVVKRGGSVAPDHTFTVAGSWVTKYNNSTRITSYTDARGATWIYSVSFTFTYPNLAEGWFTFNSGGVQVTSSITSATGFVAYTSQFWASGLGTSVKANTYITHRITIPDTSWLQITTATDTIASASTTAIDRFGRTVTLSTASYTVFGAIASTTITTAHSVQVIKSSYVYTSLDSSNTYSYANLSTRTKLKTINFVETSSTSNQYWNWPPYTSRCNYSFNTVTVSGYGTPSLFSGSTVTTGTTINASIADQTSTGGLGSAVTYSTYSISSATTYIPTTSNMTFLLTVPTYNLDTFTYTTVTTTGLTITWTTASDRTMQVIFNSGFRTTWFSDNEPFYSATWYPIPGYAYISRDYGDNPDSETTQAITGGTYAISLSTDMGASGLEQVAYSTTISTGGGTTSIWGEILARTSSAYTDSVGTVWSQPPSFYLIRGYLIGTTSANSDIAPFVKTTTNNHNNYVTVYVSPDAVMPFTNFTSTNTYTGTFGYFIGTSSTTLFNLDFSAYSESTVNAQARAQINLAAGIYRLFDGSSSTLTTYYSSTGIVGSFTPAGIAPILQARCSTYSAPIAGTSTRGLNLTYTGTTAHASMVTTYLTCPTSHGYTLEATGWVTNP